MDLKQACNEADAENFERSGSKIKQNEELLARLEQGLLDRSSSRKRLKKIANIAVAALEIRVRKLEQTYEIDIGHLQGRVRKLEESKQKTERYHETHSQNS